jgi:hypothetical protein
MMHKGTYDTVAAAGGRIARRRITYCTWREVVGLAL